MTPPKKEAKAEESSAPIPAQANVQCNWCDHMTASVAGHEVNAEGKVTKCPFITVNLGGASLRQP